MGEQNIPMSLNYHNRIFNVHGIAHYTTEVDRERKMFYLMTHSTHFIAANNTRYMASDI